MKGALDEFIDLSHSINMQIANHLLENLNCWYRRYNRHGLRTKIVQVALSLLDILLLSLLLLLLLLLMQRFMLLLILLSMCCFVAIYLLH